MGTTRRRKLRCDLGIIGRKVIMQTETRQENAVAVYFDSKNTLMPGIVIFNELRNRVPEFRQLNSQTKIVETQQRRIELARATSWQTVQEPVPVPRFRMIAITGWSYEGFKALLWRIWKAIMPLAPNHGWRVYSDSVLRCPPIPAPERRTIELKQYGYQNQHVRMSLGAAYDAQTDTLYVRDLVTGYSQWRKGNYEF